MRKISAILLRLALFLLLLPALPGMAQDMRRPAPPERPEVWFAPLDSVANYAQGGERDFISLFSNQAAWSNALSRIDVMKFYSAFVDQASDDQLRTVVQFLNAHNIKIAVETWVLHHGANGCGLQPKGDNIEGYLPKGRDDLPENIAAHIRRAGGVIRMLPLMNPDVQLGDIEILPGTATPQWIDDYLGWADAIEKRTG